MQGVTSNRSNIFNYQMQNKQRTSDYLKNIQNNAKTTNTSNDTKAVFSSTSHDEGKTIQLLGGNDEDTLFSGANKTGLSYYIQYAENSTTEDPIMIARGIDENGEEFEKTINVKDVDPTSATLIEMRALEAYLNVDKGGGFSSLPVETSAMGLNDKTNFMDMFDEAISYCNLSTQYQWANFYTNNKNTYTDFLQSKDSSTARDEM